MNEDTINRYEGQNPEQAKELSLQFFEQSKDFKSKIKIDEAIKAIDQAIDVKPDYFEAYILRSELLLDIDPQKALNDVNKAIELDPQSSDGYYHRCTVYIKVSANCHLKLKDFNSALNDCDSSISINPNFPLVYVRRGLALVCLHRQEEALKCYYRAIEIDKNCWQAYNNRGALFSDMNKNTLALMDYNKSIEINPSGDLAYNNRGTSSSILGLLYKDTGKFDLSLKDFNKSIELNQNNTLPYFNRGLLFQKLGKLEQSLHDFNKAIELDKNNSIFYLTRGALLQKMGKPQQALHDFQQAMGNIPGNKAGNQGQSQTQPIKEVERSSEGCCCQIY